MKLFTVIRKRKFPVSNKMKTEIDIRRLWGIGK